MTERYRSVTYPHRVFAGWDALGRLGAEAARLGVERAFVVSGRSLGADDGLRGRVVETLGPRLVGWYDGIEKDSTYASVRRAPRST